MSIKAGLKKAGRFLITIKQEKEKIISQSVLVVDNGYCAPEHLTFTINKIMTFYPKAEISCLVLPERKSILQKEYPGLNFILPSQRIRPKRYRIALQMLMIKKKKFDSIFLLSLDATPLIVALLSFKCQIFLFNQWHQWWSIRLRNFSEIFKITYKKRNISPGLKNFLNKIGLFLVLLQEKDNEAVKHSILVIDNGYAVFQQISCLMQRLKEFLPQAKISVVAQKERLDLKENFTDFVFIKPSKSIINRCRLARQIFSLRKNKYDYIILLSLDISPILVSILFTNSKVFLYNQWHQWWSIKPRSMESYLMIIPKFVFNFIIFVYLLISVSLIFFKKSLNVFKFNRFSEG